MLMFLLFYCFAGESAKAFHQNDYQLIHHRLELIDYNRSYLHNLKVSLVPFNRTTRALNESFDLLIDLRNSIPGEFEVYRRTLNDYRLFAFNIRSDYCKMRKENQFGVNDMEKYSNIPPCPIIKGHYYMNKYRPDESKFPPHIFPGDYKIVCKFMYGSDTFVEVHWYESVKDKDKLGK